MTDHDRPPLRDFDGELPAGMTTLPSVAPGSVTRVVPVPPAEPTGLMDFTSPGTPLRLRTTPAGPVKRTKPRASVPDPRPAPRPSAVVDLIQEYVQADRAPSPAVRNQLAGILSDALRAGTSVKDLPWAVRRLRELKLPPEAIPGLRAARSGSESCRQKGREGPQTAAEPRTAAGGVSVPPEDTCAAK